MTIGVFVSDDKFDAAYDWCLETFGHDHNNDRWYTIVEPLYSEEFIFEHEKDAILFMLRWV